MNKTFFSQKDLKKVVHLDTREKTITYQVITIAISQNAKRAGVCSLQIGSKKHDVEFTDKSSLSETLQVLYESLSRQLDRYYYVTIDDNNIVIASIFASPSEQFFFVCGSTGILAEVTVEEKNRSVVIPVLKAQEPNQIIVIDDDYDFGGEVFKVPANATLQFHGGCIKNARLKYDNTLISGDYDIVNCICEGKLANSVVRPEMFGARTLNFRNNSYDISIPIQHLIINDNYNIVINNEYGANYQWNTPVNLYNESGDVCNVSISGSVPAPVLGPGNVFSTYTVTISASKAFICAIEPQSDDDFDFSGTPWPSIRLSNLSFRFSSNSDEKIFIDGIISRSIIDSINVFGCKKFVHGGMKLTSLVTNSFIEVSNYAFGGYLVDSKVENCYFTAIRKANETNDSGLDSEPVFYMNSIDYGQKKLTGSLTATIFTNNYVDYFYTIFMMGNTWDDCIITQGNTFDIFKYFAWCKRWIGGILTDRSEQEGCLIISNGDTFRRCNNFPITNEHSTDYHLASRIEASSFVNVREHITEGSVIKYEVYSILGKIMTNSAFQINSFIDETNSYIFARKWARRNATSGVYEFEDVFFLSNPSFAFKGQYQENSLDVHSGEFICGGRPSMYPFKHLSSSVGYVIADNIRFRRPILYDLQDMTVTSLPTTQLFNGRRVIFNNEICTFRQQDSRNYVGTWVNPQGVVRGVVS